MIKRLLSVIICLSCAFGICTTAAKADYTYPDQFLRPHIILEELLGTDIENPTYESWSTSVSKQNQGCRCEWCDEQLGTTDVYLYPGHEVKTSVKDIVVSEWGSYKVVAPVKVSDSAWDKIRVSRSGTYGNSLYLWETSDRYEHVTLWTENCSSCGQTTDIMCLWTGPADYVSPEYEYKDYTSTSTQDVTVGTGRGTFTLDGTITPYVRYNAKLITPDNLWKLVAGAYDTLILSNVEFAGRSGERVGNVPYAPPTLKIRNGTLTTSRYVTDLTITARDESGHCTIEGLLLGSESITAYGFGGYTVSNISSKDAEKIDLEGKGDVYMEWVDAPPTTLNLKTTGNISVPKDISKSTAHILFKGNTVSSGNINLTQGDVQIDATTLDPISINISSSSTTYTGSVDITLAGEATISNIKAGELTLTLGAQGGSVTSTYCNEFVFRAAGPALLKNCWVYSSGSITGDQITMQNCNSSGTLDCGYSQVLVKSGTYSGESNNGAAFIGTQCVVEKGTFIDYGGAESAFILGDESERVTTPDGDKTITVVKLTNPPIVIDWGEFPGINLDIDMSAPILTVTRTNVSPATAGSNAPSTPCEKVTLSISAKDPNGTNVTLYVNGSQLGSTEANPSGTYTVTENQLVTVMAVDANGNVREYTVDVSNIDTTAPDIISVEANTTNWTKNNVRLVVTAEDNLKLHAQAYGISKPSVTNASSVTTWQAGRTFDIGPSSTYMDSNKTVRIWVRDAKGHTAWIDVKVDNIDQTAPTITSFTSNYVSGTRVLPETGVTLTVKATDAGCGLHEKPFSWNGGGWTDSSTFIAKADGTYNVQVRDALGNVVTSSNLKLEGAFATEGPTITSWSASYSSNVGDGGTMRKGYATLTVSASAGHAQLASAPYSYDGGQTWTAANTLTVYKNGYYTVLVRDVRGQTSASTISISTLDNEQPGGYITLTKAAPDDDGDGEPDKSAYPNAEDWIYWVKVTAYDNDQVYSMTCSWDGVVKKNVFEVKVPVEDPGTYSVIVKDRAGNEICLERTVTAEAIGESSGGGGGSYGIDIGAIGDPFVDGRLGDLVYGQNGYAYNRATGEKVTLTKLNGKYGIRVDFEIETRRGRVLEGEATFAGCTDNSIFNNESAANGISALGEVTAQSKVVMGSVFFPLDEITTDIANGRIVITLREYKDSDKEELTREGTRQLYTSVQVSNPTIGYSYNRTTGEVAVSAMSSVAGVSTDTFKYAIGSSENHSPGTPVPANSIISTAGQDGSKMLSIKVEDNVGNATELHIEIRALENAINGPDSLPTEENTNEGLNVYYIGGRTSEIYIIGGTQSNTDQIPSDDILTP